MELAKKFPKCCGNVSVCFWTSLCPWKVVQLDWDVGLQLFYPDAALLLRVQFGPEIEGCSFVGQAARQVADMTLVSDLKGYHLFFWKPGCQVNQHKVSVNSYRVTTILEFPKTWKCKTIRMRSGKRPKPGKSRSICVVMEIWFWQLNKKLTCTLFIL